MSTITKNLANGITSLGIIGGILACTWTIQHPSWIVSEILFLFSLLTDALDGKVARKFWGTKAGPYLDDIADMINFGIHPALWISIISGTSWLAIFFAFCVLARLVRFTVMKQESADGFSGLPSPAGALIVFGLVFVAPESQIFLIGTLFVSFLMISTIRFIHVIKYQKLSPFRIPLIVIIVILPFLFGLNQRGIGITHLTIMGIYILFSLFFLPQYARR